MTRKKERNDKNHPRPAHQPARYPGAEPGLTRPDGRNHTKESHAMEKMIEGIQIRTATPEEIMTCSFIGKMNRKNYWWLVRTLGEPTKMNLKKGKTRIQWAITAAMNTTILVYDWGTSTPVEQLTTWFISSNRNDQEAFNLINKILCVYTE